MKNRILNRKSVYILLLAILSVALAITYIFSNGLFAYLLEASIILAMLATIALLSNYSNNLN
ncbi:hypothetical protein [Reichenbachiella versicolor]|uniref:hypothetical protein n=1 Tax=Reichenbachiella versicolor TaxID=1821036 RepID=UPI0013A5852D|nr:hypothetical protein [Reichenbachiella versicolor]